MSAGLVSILDQARITGGANKETIPVLVGRFHGDGSERVGPGRPVILETLRDRDGTTGALDGTVGVYGALLPHPQSGNSGMVVMKGEDGTTGRTIFTTTLAHAAFDNNNWIVIVNGVVHEHGAGAGKYVYSDASGFGRITFGTALQINDVVEIYKITPVELLAVGAHAIEKTRIIGKSVYWVDYVVASTNLSRTLVTIRPEAQ